MGSRSITFSKALNGAASLLAAFLKHGSSYSFSFLCGLNDDLTPSGDRCCVVLSFPS